jgi:prevent-host-death family protein
MDVEATDLQQHLSEHLQRVVEGEFIRVTELGVPVALIAPITVTHPLQRGIDEGWIRPQQRTGRVGEVERVKSSRRIADVLAEERGR